MTAVTAGLITLVLLPVAPPGVPIVAASLAALIGLRRCWLVIALVGAVTLLFKASGPVLLQGATCRRGWPRSSRCSHRRCSPRSSSRRPSAATARLVLDERLVGVAAGGIAVWLRAPLLAVMVVAGATAALVRLL